MTTPRFSPAAAARAQAARRAYCLAAWPFFAQGSRITVCPPAMARGASMQLGGRLAVAAARREFFRR